MVSEFYNLFYLNFGRLIYSILLVYNVLQVWEIVYAKDGSVKEVSSAMQLKGHKVLIRMLFFCDLEFKLSSYFDIHKFCKPKNLKDIFSIKCIILFIYIWKYIIC